MTPIEIPGADQEREADQQQPSVTTTPRRLRDGDRERGVPGLVRTRQCHRVAEQRLVDELKKEFTIVIVTHNMQQAARISDFTAYMYLGELIEFGDTSAVFTNPKRKETEDYITGRFG